MEGVVLGNPPQSDPNLSVSVARVRPRLGLVKYVSNSKGWEGRQKGRLKTIKRNQHRLSISNRNAEIPRSQKLSEHMLGTTRIPDYAPCRMAKIILKYV